MSMLVGQGRRIDMHSEYAVVLLNRAVHTLVIDIFLRNIHPIVQRQQLEYGIFVVGQSESGIFNRGQIGRSTS